METGRSHRKLNFATVFFFKRTNGKHLDLLNSDYCKKVDAVKTSDENKIC